MLASPVAVYGAGHGSHSVSGARLVTVAAAKKKKTAAKSSSAAKKGSAKKGTAARGSARNGSGKKGAAVRGRKGRARTKAGRAVSKQRKERFSRAFVESSELRPMTQQLMTMRTPSAYAGVTDYARRHTGDSAAAAYLALGFAYQKDRRYTDSAAAFHQANVASDVLDDYADYLGAMSDHAGGNEAGAEALLKGFGEKYPDSIFDDAAADLEANVLLAMNDAAGAQKALAQASDEAQDKPSFDLTRAKIAQMQGNQAETIQLYKHLLLKHPLSSEAETARTNLTSNPALAGAESTLTTSELRSLGDAYYNAGKYQLAGDQYRALVRNAALDASARDGFAVAAATCDLKLKRLSMAQAAALADTNDESGARRIYLMVELERGTQNYGELESLVAQMKQRFAQSPWLAEALYSAGTTYLLKHEYAQAAGHFSYLAAHFPTNKNAASAHWKAGWMIYRQSQYADAAKIFEDQIRLFPGAPETASALYWRARIYELDEHKPEMAVPYYRALVRAYQHYYYAELARQRIVALGQAGTGAGVVASGLERFQAPVIPHLDETVPADSEHIAKARFLANAGLNEYVSQELEADPDSAGWSALAEAQIYASFGDTYHALRVMKKAIPFASSAPVGAIPMAYWRILFPQPWWGPLKAESGKNGLDPYLVASLIRQESEFNPAIISYANAYGLMQVEPSTGRMLARQEGIGGFSTNQLLNPELNLRLGTRYFKQLLDRFGGVPEYALAAYNAGESRVVDWQAAGPYRGMDEFVESIPFTQTREYVQAIMRNVEMYRALDAGATSGVNPVANREEAAQ
jgi:soluble lytic murein transglycosylase